MALLEKCDLARCYYAFCVLCFSVLTINIHSAVAMADKGPVVQNMLVKGL